MVQKKKDIRIGIVLALIFIEGCMFEYCDSSANMARFVFLLTNRGGMAQGLGAMTGGGETSSSEVWSMLVSQFPGARDIRDSSALKKENVEKFPWVEVRSLWCGVC